MDNKAVTNRELNSESYASSELVKAVLRTRDAKTMREKLEAFEHERTLIVEGDSVAVKEQRKNGGKTARERVSGLLDKNSFEELETYKRPYETGTRGEETGQGDGLVVGFGTINNKPVAICSQDATVMGGTVGTVHARKATIMLERAINARIPIINILDSKGLRTQDAIQNADFYSFSSMAYFQTLASGVIPKISLVMGQCDGENAVLAGLSDFLFMVRKQSYMGLMPLDTRTRDQSLLESADMNARVGSCSVLANDEEDCLAKCRTLLSYLPSNNTSPQEKWNSGDDPERREEELLDVVPIDTAKVFNMHKLITLIVDDGELFEIQSHFARNLITGFVRLGGFTVGLLASNPRVLGGCMNLDAADKMSRFVRFCDAFNIPLLWVADTPAFVPSVDEETRGLIRHGSRMIMVTSQATVPRITLSVRKHFGGGRLAMPGPFLASDIAVAWPTLQPGLMGAEGAVSIIYRKEIQDIKDPAQKKDKENQRIEEMRWNLDLQVREGSDQIIDPRDSRPFLIKAFQWFRNRKEELPKRKHDNNRM